MTRSELGTAIGVGAVLAGLWCWLRDSHEPTRNPLGIVCKHCGSPVDLGRIERERSYSRKGGLTRSPWWGR